MRHASLFSGLGGFDLAAEWMGWENKFSCEIDPFCQRVLLHHFSSTHNYGDIRELDGTKYRGQIDVLTGGFPCQPFSVAGERRGEDDARFLWPEMLRVVREVQPTWIVAENVRGITSIENGMVFERVCAELEANGYEVQALCIPACAVNAPHRRDRMWFIAQADVGRLRRHERQGTQEGAAPRGVAQGDANNTKRTRLEGHCGNEPNGGRRTEPTRPTPEAAWSEHWHEAATRLCRVDDGLPRRLDGITVPAWRRESLKAYGNAIVPQIAYRIFQAISQAQNG